MNNSIKNDKWPLMENGIGSSRTYINNKMNLMTSITRQISL